MTSGTSDCSYPSDLDDHIEEYTREDYWVHYNFHELIEDVKCTIYSNYAIAHEIQCALEQAAEDEGITWFDPIRHSKAILIKYQSDDIPLTTHPIRFKPSNDNKSTSNWVPAITTFASASSFLYHWYYLNSTWPWSPILHCQIVTSHSTSWFLRSRFRLTLHFELLVSFHSVPVWHWISISAPTKQQLSYHNSFRSYCSWTTTLNKNILS